LPYDFNWYSKPYYICPCLILSSNLDSEDKELNMEELRKLDAFDLRIIRNMIFAKHNYGKTSCRNDFCVILSL